MQFGICIALALHGQLEPHLIFIDPGAVQIFLGQIFAPLEPVLFRSVFRPE